MEATDIWQPARLIPAIGERGQKAQERRATSILLAVMQIVPDFGKDVLSQVGAPRGRLSCFVEVPLKDEGSGKTLVPDGVVVVQRGSTKWRCLVEAKTGRSTLAEEQVSSYVDLARQHTFDAVVTVSNELAPAAGESPIRLDGRRLRKVDLKHLSWWRILTAAVVQQEHRGVSDPEQAWILGEFIAYARHEGSGVGDFEDLGDGWVGVRDGARSETLSLGDPAVGSVAERWEQFVQFLALGLRQDLGRNIAPAFSRGSTSESRLDATRRELATSGRLTAALRIPDTVGSLEVDADLRARQLRISTTVGAPKEGRPRTRINWLVRQLKDAPGELRLEVRFSGCREIVTATLEDAREDATALLSEVDPSREPRSFTITRATAVGKKRGQTKGSFAGDTRRDLIEFYERVVQVLRPWSPRAPQLRKRDEPDPEPAGGAGNGEAISGDREAVAPEPPAPPSFGSPYPKA